MKQKVALYENRESVGRTRYVFDVTDWMEDDNQTYIRVSDIQEVDFTVIPDDLIIPRKIEALRIQKTQKMAEFDEKISNLMAITYNPESIVEVEDMAENPQEEDDFDSDEDLPAAGIIL